MHQRFLRTYVLAGLIFALPFAVTAAFVTRAGETMPYADVAAWQGRTGALYGSAFNQNNFLYKLELVRQRRPSVIALGSSRSMVFRQEAFTTDFVNCGGAMNTLKEGSLFLERLFQIHKPEAILLGLDFWWFNSAVPQPDHYVHHASTGEDLSFEKLVNPIRYLLDGRTEPSRFLGVLLGGDRKNPALDMDNLGLQAILRAEGFRPDGSRLYAGPMAGEPGFWDYRFADTLSRIRQGRRMFQYGAGLDPARVRDFEAIVETCRRSGVRLAVFIHPLTEAARRSMAGRGPDYAYVEEFRRWAAGRPEVVRDYHQAETLGSNDCEFVDGFHGGDVLYLRLLLDLLDSGAAPWLRDYVDEERVRRVARHEAGRALARFGETAYRFEEGDFLGIGCVKKGEGASRTAALSD